MTYNFRSLLAACALLAFSLPAQAWPDKPLRMIVPFAAGGTTDVIARIVAERLTAKFGTSIVVEMSAAQAAIQALLLSRRPRMMRIHS